MAFDKLVQGGNVVLSQDFGQTAYAMACKCEWTCPGYLPASFHAGIDIASVDGSRPLLLAVGWGTCVKVGRVMPGPCSGLGPYAPAIRVSDGSVDVWYGHALKNLVNIGDVVAPGQPVAIMDSIGCSTGNHVHYEVVPAGSDPDGCSALNPWAYVNVWPGGPIVSTPPPAPAPGPVATGSSAAGLLLAAGGAALLFAARAKAGA